MTTKESSASLAGLLWSDEPGEVDLLAVQAIAETVADAVVDDALDPLSLGLSGHVQNDEAVLQMGDELLKKMAAELVVSIRQNATIDWNLKESVRATMRPKVRRLLAKYDYPPDLEEKAIELVLEQAESFADSGDLS